MYLKNVQKLNQAMNYKGIAALCKVEGLSKPALSKTLYDHFTQGFRFSTQQNEIKFTQNVQNSILELSTASKFKCAALWEVYELSPSFDCNTSPCLH